MTTSTGSIIKYNAFHYLSNNFLFA